MSKRNLGMVTFDDFDNDCQQFSAPKNYIAPLMGDFEITDDFYPSFVSYAQNDDEFLVEWHKVGLKDRKDGMKYLIMALFKLDKNIAFSIF